MSSDQERIEETLFAGFLARREDDEAPDFESWVDEHREHATALRELYLEHRELEDLLAHAHGGEPLLELDRIVSRERDVDRYRLEGEIARGGQGSVLRVWDEDLQRHLAMKVILGRVRSNEGDTPPVDSRSLGRFLEEARVTGQLDHPGIVPIHELGIDRDERAYFTMKLVKGKSLRDVLGEVQRGVGDWTVPRVLGMLLRVCEALGYAHSKGILHRDLKPSNIMLGEFGEVYVMDWGLARARGASNPDATPIVTGAGERAAPEDERYALRTRDGDVVGTPAFMSPEQARGELDLVDEQSDVYSLGAILFQLLTGRVPYSELGKKSTVVDIWKAVKTRAPAGLDDASVVRPKAGVTEELVSICRRAMARERTRRYADAEALADDLRAYLEGRVVRAHEAGALAELRKWTKRNRALATVIVAAVLSLSITGFALARTQARRADAAEVQHRRLELDVELGRARELARAVTTPPPVHPDAAREWEHWVASYRELEAQREDFARRLDELRKAATVLDRVAVGGAERAALEQRLRALRLFVEGFEALSTNSASDAETRRIAAAEIDLYRLLVDRVERRLEPVEVATFATLADSKEFETLTELVTLLDGLSSDASGDAEWMRARAAEVARLARWTIEDEAARWSAAAASIADEASCPAYRGLALAPQVGLIPLRRDPGSGLWEFWHVSSGDEPRLGSDDRWQVTDSTGMVFVLVPGGSVRIGAQPQDPAGPRFDPWASTYDGPPLEVRLAPYFLSKYEMTQGQWIRATRTQPAEHFAGKSTATVPRVTRAHPVEHVSWNDATATLALWKLTLPTEAQWEHAARAGGEFPYGHEADFEALADHVNYGDQSYLDVGKTPPGAAPTHDGYLYHAPVGRRRPNAFGFHDMLDNVREWALDRQAEDFTPRFLADVLPETGELVPVISLHHAVRGGCYMFGPEDLRVSIRMRLFPNTADENLGLRPCRCLDSH